MKNKEIWINDGGFKQETGKETEYTYSIQYFSEGNWREWGQRHDLEEAKIVFNNLKGVQEPLRLIKIKKTIDTEIFLEEEYNG